MNGAIKCQQISGGDGYATMGDGTQTYMFSFGPLSGLADMADGQAGHGVLQAFSTCPTRGREPALSSSRRSGHDGRCCIPDAFNWNGAVGLIGDPDSSFANGRCSGDSDCNRCRRHCRRCDDYQSRHGVQRTGDGDVQTSTYGSGALHNANPCQTALGTVVITNGKVTDIDITFAGEGYTTTAPTVTISAPMTGCTANSAIRWMRDRPCRSPADHGRRRHERQHSRSADGHR